MAQSFKYAAIFGKPRADGIGKPLAEIAAIVERAGATPLFDAATRAAARLDAYPGYSLQQIGKRADVAIVLGGDGTMLGIARELAPFQVPLIGVNHGRLGFITDIALDQIEVLADMLAGRYVTDRRALLEAAVLRDGAAIFGGRALNDVVVSRGVAGGLVEFTVRVDGVTMYNQRADGLIVATPTGSTAYALSANGPILHPSLAGLVLVPVAPQTLSNRPITLPDSCVLEIELTDGRDASAHCDMQSFWLLQPGDVVRVYRSAEVVTLLHPVGYNYFATLRQKLHWNVMPSERHGRA
ncbi:MAG: NAD kinase [Sutterellaceae bacterium]|nr:NAD kinase [Burkholderiaceae bacterium]MCX7901671.1 NAD kinase [Burkholderiaceae bacterium]MDW8430167.1 NAD kinase [Sutterellaceae bacterium]